MAGSAVKLGIFSDFWRGASARAKNRKKCFKNGGGISAEIAAKNSAEIPRIRKWLRKLLGTGVTCKDNLISARVLLLNFHH